MSSNRHPRPPIRRKKPDLSFRIHVPPCVARVAPSALLSDCTLEVFNTLELIVSAQVVVDGKQKQLSPTTEQVSPAETDAFNLFGSVRPEVCPGFPFADPCVGALGHPLAAL